MYTSSLTSQALEEISSKEWASEISPANFADIYNLSFLDDTNSGHPIHFLVSVRTDYSNEVVCNDSTFYFDCEVSINEALAPFEDLLYLSCKEAVHKVFGCKDTLPQIIRRSDVSAVGACIIDSVPYMFSTVVLDHKLKSESYFNLLEGMSLKPIQSLSAQNKLEEALIPHLIIINRGGESNVDDNNS